MSLVALQPLTPIKAQNLPADTTVGTLAEAYDSLRYTRRQLESGKPEWAILCQRAEQWAKAGGIASVRTLDGLIDECSPVGWYTDDDQVSRPWLSLVLGQLVGSFPTSNLPNAGIYTRMLLEDVAAEAPTYAELATTCRRIRRTMKFMPSIAEVIDVLTEEQAAWNSRQEARMQVLLLLSEDTLNMIGSYDD